ncbi:dihydropteroate synthase [Haloferax sp. MBLA0076]|uniref:dihydropteroate synthase n=1 Tax=Haloferax litoreum TaxID=2666140 RepID=A0A6A8GIJ3_9EURY|nr:MULTISPECIES: dihydropteroate synthase [Haloferax]KAB1194032.1 dihydropteroate synthase [Haloferax sp. CBA1148]MRX22581.1 dihydropteroate synthase [Haloferax litoreum]
MRTVDAAGLEIGDDHPPRIMGVLNVSKESPYKPSVFNDPSEAAEYVDRELIDEGADIVDIGLESANKRLDVLSAEDELDRLDTALSVLDHVSGDAVFSIETRYHEVAEAALANGFDMVNDICGFADPKMPAVCEEFDAAVAKMASPPDLTRPGAIEEVDDIYDALELNGFTDKTIVDPAFGGWSEAKTLEHDRETFHRLREFRGYGYPILVSINRKNFLRDVAGRSTEDALPVSLAATSMAVERGAHVIRTHDVRETRDAALIGHEFKRRRVREPGDVSVEELDVTTPGDAARHLDRMGAPRDVAAESVTRVFELEGLAESDRETLAAAAADAGAVFAGGETGGLLVGTPTALRRVPDVVRGSSDALEAAVETIARGVQ